MTARRIEKYPVRQVFRLKKRPRIFVAELLFQSLDLLDSLCCRQLRLLFECEHLIFPVVVKNCGLQNTPILDRQRKSSAIKSKCACCRCAVLESFYDCPFPASSVQMMSRPSDLNGALQGGDSKQSVTSSPSMVVA